MVDIAGAVTLNLPPAAASAAGAQAIPGSFVGAPIVVLDVGGHASAVNVITIASAENIDGFASITIENAYGAYTLNPNTPDAGWTIEQ